MREKPNPVIEELFVTDKYKQLLHEYASLKLHERQQYYQNPDFRHELALLKKKLSSGKIKWIDWMNEYCEIMKKAIKETERRKLRGLHYILQQEGKENVKKILAQLKKYGIYKSGKELNQSMTDSEYQLMIIALDSKNKKKFMERVGLSEKTLKSLISKSLLLVKLLKKKFKI